MTKISLDMTCFWTNQVRSMSHRKLRIHQVGRIIELAPGTRAVRCLFVIVTLIGIQVGVNACTPLHRVLAK